MKLSLSSSHFLTDQFDFQENQNENISKKSKPQSYKKFFFFKGKHKCAEGKEPLLIAFICVVFKSENKIACLVDNWLFGRGNVECAYTYCCFFYQQIYVKNST